MIIGEKYTILPFTIIISTHEENFYEIMKVKLSSEYYNSKFFVFESEGRIMSYGFKVLVEGNSKCKLY